MARRCPRHDVKLERNGDCGRCEKEIERLEEQAIAPEPEPEPPAAFDPDWHYPRQL